MPRPTRWCFTCSKKDICDYLLGPGYEAYHNDAELRHLFDPFGDIVLAMESRGDISRLKKIFQLYEGALLSQIRNHISGVRVLDPAQFEETVDLLIELMFDTKV